MKFIPFSLLCLLQIVFQSSSRAQEQTIQKSDRIAKTEHTHSILSDKELNELFQNNIPLDLPLRKEYTSDKVYFKVIQGYLNANPGSFNESYAKSLGMQIPVENYSGEKTQGTLTTMNVSDEEEIEFNRSLHPKIRQKYTAEALERMSFKEKAALNHYYYHSYRLVSNEHCSISGKEEIDVTQFEKFRKTDEQVKIVLDESCGAYILLRSSNELNH
jgi:hypothetical protein